MIKISKKAARQLGSDIATELNAQKTIEARGGVLNARSVILGHLEFLLQQAFEEGFDATLDFLEPYPSGNRRSIYRYNPK